LTVGRLLARKKVRLMKEEGIEYDFYQKGTLEKESFESNLIKVMKSRLSKKFFKEKNIGNFE